MHSCRYQNERPQLVILRCLGAGGFFLEKVIFPFESWNFDCPPHSRVEIWTYGMAGVELLDAINAEELRLVSQDDRSWGLDQRGFVASFCDDLQEYASESPAEVAVSC